ncbi:MAG: C40 family peptidase [Bacteroidales bacterium]|nr:C40 family peptidase [Bacteroidales bacterium]
MKKNIKLCVYAVCVCLTINACTPLRNFFNADLEDEDFEVTENFDGQKTYRRVPSKKKDRSVATNTGKGGKMPITVTDRDNAKLYKVIEKWYGTPYKYGGCSTSGIDCSCFVKNVFSEVYDINLNRVAADITKNVTLIERSQLREGDVVFFSNNKTAISHVGIYLKDGMFAHASSSKGVTISKLSEKYWDTRFYKGGRHAKVTTKW